ncbi:Argonaute siRNA chaperone complex subunit Arb1-domain-containing protein [Phaeosphaeriaceae sp. PMI808]|nr:Argonaute siRNA chaperone complex subunit Arb1-domain-containing protein [Phaeosphaeriaceae sp. PMI808]
MSTQAAVNDDHPEGDQIRQQAEYYFSDENLPTDIHLLQHCGGRKNEPVSISRICGFKKMRGYKPKSLVIVALRKSTFLEVSTDGKKIKRKIPFEGKCALDPDFYDNYDIAHDSSTRKPKPAVLPIPQLLKKVEYPPGMTKNMMKPTGFEDTFIEAPITPQEAAEEEDMYDVERPLVERIEIAIQCFKQRRKMHQMYAQVFTTLMLFGGVENGPRMYQGITQQEIAEMDAEGRARAMATHNIPWDRLDEKQWTVDFAAIAKAFLSSWYPAHFGCAPNVIKHACQVLTSFYNYLRYHNVCPDYDSQVEEALKICALAKHELPMVNAAGLAFPGEFNTSASVIFGGAQAGLYAVDKSWAEESRRDGIAIDKIGVRDEEAGIKFTIGVAIMGSDEQYNGLESGCMEILEHIPTGLEVIDIQLPSEHTKALYEEQSKVFEQKLGQLEPLGKLICKAWYADNYEEWDLPRHKYPNGKPHRTGAGREYEFWVEGSILEECFVGMKMAARILILGNGLTILDEVTEVMCSFFTWLPNELWVENRPKEVRWLEKGLPGAEELATKKDQDDGEEEGEGFDDE